MQLLKLRSLAPMLIVISLVGGSVALAEMGGGRKDKKAKKGEPAGAKAKAGEASVDCRMEISPAGLTGVAEASGLALGRRTAGILWAHRDSYPDEPTLFAFDAHGAARGKVRVTGVKTTDWEDIAMGACGGSSCVYLADIGDNQGVRPSIAIHRVSEPLPTDPATRPGETFEATYPDGPHDAEAMFVTASGEIFIVTKGEHGPIALYRFPPSPKPGTRSVLQKVGVLRSGVARKADWITGASASPDGKWMALRSHGAVFFYEADRLVKGDFNSPLRFDATSLREPQGEGVALGVDGALFLAGESGGKGVPGTFASGVCTLPPTSH